MSRLLSVEEYERIPLGTGPTQVDPEEVPALLSSWDSLTGSAAEDYFEMGGRWIKPKGWTGVISGGGVSIEVLPRGAKSLDPMGRGTLDRNLGQMLEYSIKGATASVKEVEMSQAGTLYERVAEALCDAVARARRLHHLRGYHRVETDARSLRGRIRFPDQALLELRRPGYFASQWVELTDDVPINRFIRGVLRLLSARVSGGVRRRIDELLVDLSGVVDVDPSIELGRIDKSRLPADYREAVRLGAAVLDEELPGLFSGTSMGTANVLLLPRLFDDFVSGLIVEMGRSRNFDGKRKVRDRFLAHWLDGPFKSESLVEVIPDAEAVLNDGRQIVVDAKWKKLEHSRSGFGIAASDIHQMLAYGVRLGCRSTVLIYPAMTRYPAPAAVKLRAGLGSMSVDVSVVELPLLWNGLQEPMDHLYQQLTIA